MHTKILREAIVPSVLTILCCCPLGKIAFAFEVDYERDVRPILADKCYACHGPDESQRQAGLRLDTREGILADLGGYAAVVPGDHQASELVRRITAESSEAMPPEDHPKQLSESEKQILIEWITEGAAWKAHWAYLPPRRHATPKPKDEAWCRNWIDAFILDRLEQEAISPSPLADSRILIRRLYFDLVGLPPTPEAVDAFAADHSPAAYERVVDRLLQSPHFGERLAIYWLDLVRYADTVGYHGDQDVSVSPYRDYVINAFNNNLPFDQFTRENLAGDLLDSPTVEQLVASGYNRLGMMSAEGGVQPEEYLAKYAADRVRNASTVWLGTTLGCAECHDHKFDPFSSKDFYRFAAFFADIKEKGLYSGANKDGNWGPSVSVPDPGLEVLLEPFDRAIRRLESRVRTLTPTLVEEFREWQRATREAISISQEPSAVLADQATELARQDDVSVETNESGTDESLPVAPEIQPELRSIVSIDETQRTEEQQQALVDYFLGIAPELQPVREQLARLKSERAELIKSHTRTSLITVAVEPREIRVLHRGNWMDRSGEIVEPGAPSLFRQFGKEERATRLDLANWLVDRQNPLTARVFVNRLWKLYFGTGLSKVLDDLGSQGESPSHPRLLDCLAVEFMESGWDIKHMIKLLVMSQTYRQSSLPRPELESADPYNRLLARQSRYRLDAELIRDNALAVSGLLVHRLGGRSTKPYQPAGLLRHLNFPPRKYHADTGENQYRRGVYTKWQRQFLHPAMQTFDAPAREECTAERPRSNTPLAALVLLNDPSYVEAARVLAERTIAHAGETSPGRLDWMIRTVLSRKPSKQEVEVLQELVNEERRAFRGSPESAEELLAIGLSEPAHEFEPTELAAWTSVARAVLNLHETITRN